MKSKLEDLIFKARIKNSCLTSMQENLWNFSRMHDKNDIDNIRTMHAGNSSLKFFIKHVATEFLYNFMFEQV